MNELKLSHVDTSGAARMIDVSEKKMVRRSARASGKIYVSSHTVALIKENALVKGDVLATARLAGIMGAKHTSSLIPLCHNIEIEHISVDLHLVSDGVEIEATAVCSDKTGIEMEALTAVSIAALTIWDMCKAVDKEMRIADIVLLEKKKEEIL